MNKDKISFQLGIIIIIIFFGTITMIFTLDTNNKEKICEQIGYEYVCTTSSDVCVKGDYMRCVLVQNDTMTEKWVKR